MQGYVLEATDGERMFNSSGEVVIKADPTRGSSDLSLGTQLVPSGVGFHVMCIPTGTRRFMCWTAVASSR
jgi:hypothetical protein